MKRIMTLLLAAGLVFGATSAAKAVDIKATGFWQFGFDWGNNSIKKSNHGDTFDSRQRLRTQIDIITSESLKGVVFFEIGHQKWGQASTGASFGNDGNNIIKVRYSYIDWIVPQTDLKIRMGLQPYALPGFVAGDNVLGGNDGAGITASYEFNENFGATLFWMRAENNNTGSENNDGWRKHGQNDAMDFVGLTLPIKGDGFKVTPWGMYGNIGRNSFSGDLKGDGRDLRHYMLPLGVLGGDPNNSLLGLKDLDGYSGAWWVGLGGELPLFSPFRVALDAAYGSMDMGTINNYAGTNKSFDVKRAGWYVAALAEYKLDFMTPGLVFWYGSGDDDNPFDGSERMPALEPGFSATSFGFDGGQYGDNYDKIGKSPDGTWGVVARLKDITFIENLKHLFEVAYYRGTNDSEMVNFIGTAGPVSAYSDNGGRNNDIYMTKDDWAFEVNFNSEYKIYEDLSVALKLGYIRMDIDENNWEKAGLTNFSDEYSKNLYKVGVYMRYDF